MSFIAVSGSLLLILVLFMREQMQQKRYRRQTELIQHLHSNLTSTQNLLNRNREDIFVLRTMLEELQVLDPAEFARSRARLIEDPRRTAQEQHEMQQYADATGGHVVIDDGDTVH